MYDRLRLARAGRRNKTDGVVIGVYDLELKLIATWLVRGESRTRIGQCSRHLLLKVLVGVLADLEIRRERRAARDERNQPGFSILPSQTTTPSGLHAPPPTRMPDFTLDYCE